MPNKYKGKPRGARLAVDWGLVKTKVNGQTKSARAYSGVLKDIATKVGLKEATNLPKPTVGKDKKGRALLKGGASIAKHVGRHYLLVSIGEKGKANAKTKVTPFVFYRVPIPAKVALATAIATISKAGKATRLILPGGKLIILKASK